MCGYPGGAAGPLAPALGGQKRGGGEARRATLFVFSRPLFWPASLSRPSPYLFRPGLELLDGLRHVHPIFFGHLADLCVEAV